MGSGGAVDVPHSVCGFVTFGVCFDFTVLGVDMRNLIDIIWRSICLLTATAEVRRVLRIFPFDGDKLRAPHTTELQCCLFVISTLLNRCFCVISTVIAL